MKPLVLFCPEMTHVADKLRDLLGLRVELGEVRGGHFGNGWPMVCIENAAAVKGRDVVFLASFDAPANTIEQLGLIYAMKFYGARVLDVWLPFYPTGTQERIVEYGEIVTAKTLARMISATPRLASGEAAKFHIYDIHAEAEAFFFGDSVQYSPHTAMPLFRRELANLPNIGNIIPAFPDTGAVKRFGRLLPEFTRPVVYHKERHGNDVNLVLVEGDPAHRDVWIIDDIARSCGTILACKDDLLARDAASVSVFFVHGECTGGSWKKLLDTGFTNAWMTDSCPTTVQAVEGKDPFRILSLAPELKELIYQQSIA